jgi:hypothetical protein
MGRFIPTFWVYVQGHQSTAEAVAQCDYVTRVPNYVGMCDDCVVNSLKGKEMTNFVRHSLCESGIRFAYSISWMWMIGWRLDGDWTENIWGIG